jgi:hypothetical protein
VSFAGKLGIFRDIHRQFREVNPAFATPELAFAAQRRSSDASSDVPFEERFRELPSGAATMMGAKLLSKDR